MAPTDIFVRVLTLLWLYHDMFGVLDYGFRWIDTIATHDP